MFAYLAKCYTFKWDFTSKQCCGSGMFIPDPGSWFLPIPDPGSRIPDPKIATKERGEKKFDVISFYIATKIVTKLSKVWVWDPGSGKNLSRIPDPGVKKAPDPGSGSATLPPRPQKFYPLFLEIFIINLVWHSVADPYPNPYVFGPLGSGSFYHQEK